MSIRTQEDKQRVSFNGKSWWTNAAIIIVIKSQWVIKSFHIYGEISVFGYGIFAKFSQKHGNDLTKVKKLVQPKTCFYIIFFIMILQFQFIILMVKKRILWVV